MKLGKLISFDGEADEVLVRFANLPTENTAKFLVESAFHLDEGKIQQWPGGFSTRIDRRPANQGGTQIHVYGAKGQKWAYRYDGSKSEPNKYTLPTTNRVRDIVSKALKLDPNQIAEFVVKSMEDRLLIVEARFA